MCGIAGWISLNGELPRSSKIVETMTETLANRGPDEEGYYINTNVHFGHKRLTVVDPEGGKQPMTKKNIDKGFTIVYNGELYNTEEIRDKLKNLGHKFIAYSDTEVLLTAYIEWGEECLRELNGIFAFAIWDQYNQKLFIARDPLGVKPLFYSIVDNKLIFASEIKAILAHPMVEPQVDSQGLCEIFGLGPARSLGNGVFRQIKEVPPAHFLTTENGQIKLREYWKLEAKEHPHSLDETTEYVRALLLDAIKRQLVSDVPICTFLSGGLDSSAISKVAADALKEQGKTLKTFSIDYQDNDKYFKKSLFQPNSDSHWVDVMSNFIGSEHHRIILNQEDLVVALENAVAASDLPSMADIDSSLYLFSKEVRKHATVGLSGECADEIFGGYPWFTNIEMQNTGTFPWSPAIIQREKILSKNINLPLGEYIKEKYIDTINSTPKLSGETSTESKMREIFNLNLKWFMVTLLNRKDRMTMANSLEVRVPFADYRLVEYSFNIPKDIRLVDSREKGLLRRALRGILPQEIIDRKKSPYPKTFHPVYTHFVTSWMERILVEKSSPILQIIDMEQTRNLVATGGRSFDRPWYGQLMTGPQLIAYLIQIDLWMRMYKVKLV